ncbi:hypothetical protein, partial [Lactiplantibacillus plantarum]
FVVNTILKEADLFCPNSVRINFTIYQINAGAINLVKFDPGGVIKLRQLGRIFVAYFQKTNYYIMMTKI